jgi:hypothetical protein
MDPEIDEQGYVEGRIASLVQHFADLGLDIEPERCDVVALREDAGRLAELANLLEGTT